MELDQSVQWLYGSGEALKHSSAPLPPFADEVIEWLNALSASLMKDPQSRLYPDVVTFAFFCRKGNLHKLKVQYVGALEAGQPIRLGRGQVFHIAPSNVPVNFAYSLVSGLLAGNSNIVRVSSKPFPQVDLIVKHICALRDFNATAERIAIVRYPHESNANELFSSRCDVRVIWGGDATIARIRQCSLKPRAFDICFADRYSVAALDACSVLAMSQVELDTLAQGFYNDTYLFDQNACSAPHLVLWIGDDEHIAQAQQRFWRAVYQVVQMKYKFQEKMAVDKLNAFYRQAAAMPVRATSHLRDKNNEAVSPVTSDSKGLLVCVDLPELPPTIDEYRCACGYFSEHKATSLDVLAPIVTDKYQTLAYLGFEENGLADFVLRNRLQGIDRIVPIGTTTDFSLTWDGMNLIERLSRIVDIRTQSRHTAKSLI